MAAWGKGRPVAARIATGAYCGWVARIELTTDVLAVAEDVFDACLDIGMHTESMGASAERAVGAVTAGRSSGQAGRFVHPRGDDATGWLAGLGYSRNMCWRRFRRVGRCSPLPLPITRRWAAMPSMSSAGPSRLTRIA